MIKLCFSFLFIFQIFVANNLIAENCIGFFINKVQFKNEISRTVETYNINRKNYIVEKYQVGPTIFYEKTVGFMQTGQKFKLYNIAKFNDQTFEQIISLFLNARQERLGKKEIVNGVKMISYLTPDGDLLVLNSNYDSVLGFIPLSSYGLSGKIKITTIGDKSFLIVKTSDEATAILSLLTGKLYVYSNTILALDLIKEHMASLIKFTKSMNTSFSIYLVNSNMFFVSSGNQGGKTVLDHTGKPFMVLESEKKPLNPNVISTYIEEKLHEVENGIVSKKTNSTEAQVLDFLKNSGVNGVLNNFLQIKESKLGRKFTYGDNKFIAAFMDNGDLLITDSGYRSIVNVLPFSQFVQPQTVFLEKEGYTYILVTSKNGSGVFDALTGSNLIYSRVSISKKSISPYIEDILEFARVKGFFGELYLVDGKKFYLAPLTNGYRIVYDEAGEAFLRLDFANKDFSLVEIEATIKKYDKIDKDSQAKPGEPRPIGFL